MEQKRIMRRLDLNIFQNSFYKNPVLYSPNFNYFGQISQKDFIKYWTNDKIPKDKNQLGKTIPGHSFVINEIFYPNDIKDNFLDDFIENLNKNIKNYFKGKIIPGKKNGDFRTIHKGKKAIKAFKKDLIKNINQESGATPDITLVDVTKRMSHPYLFFRDFLKDMLIFTENFKEEYQKTEKLIKEWGKTYDYLYEQVVQKETGYESRINILPQPKLYNKNILSETNKKELLNQAKKMEKMEKELFLSLAQKLKNYEKNFGIQKNRKTKRKRYK